MDRRGKFIVFEGMDGAGKTTQINLLYKELLNRNLNPLFTREPGGTPISEKIRELVLSMDNIGMDDVTEMLLYAAARAQHVKKLIIPALKEGRIIICDRFVFSSYIYQGYGRCLGIETVKTVNDIATRGLIPDLTVVLTIAPEESAKRTHARAVLDRIESQEQEFHEKVYNGIKILLEQDKTLTAIDASRSEEEIHEEIKQLVYKVIYSDSEIERIMNLSISSDISCDSLEKNHVKKK